MLLDQQGVTERQILLLAASTENDRRGTQTMFPSTCFMNILNEDVKNYENKKMTLYANPTPQKSCQPLRLHQSLFPLSLKKAHTVKFNPVTGEEWQYVQQSVRSEPSVRSEMSLF